MTQNDVYNLLKAEDKWMTAKEIAKILNTGAKSISTNLNKLLKSGDVIKEARTVVEGGALWQIKKEFKLEEEAKEENEEA
jgi:predicted transcriptional regulator